MSNNKQPNPTTKQQILKILEPRNGAITVNELSALTHITIAKIRNRLTTFESDIVRVGDNSYDLAERVYKGKKFRYSPTAREIKKGILQASDVGFFLNSPYDYTDHVILIDDQKNQHTLSRAKLASSIRSPYLSGLSKFYKITNFIEGDDIIFTCVDIKTHTFLIEKEARAQRDEFTIKIKNQKLANMVFDIINHTIPKQETDMFLFRKYLYVYPYNEPTPPDHLIKALENDKRLLISKRDPMFSWTGRLLDDWLTIGLKKYYFLNYQKIWTPVLIEKNKNGKRGYCTQCNDWMHWDKKKGWQHPEIEGEYRRRYINPSFFSFDSNKKGQN